MMVKVVIVSISVLVVMAGQELSRNDQLKDDELISERELNGMISHVSPLMSIIRKCRVTFVEPRGRRSCGCCNGGNSLLVKLLSVISVVLLYFFITSTAAGKKKRSVELDNSQDGNIYTLYLISKIRIDLAVNAS